MSIVTKIFVVINFVASIFFLSFALNVWTAQTKWQKMYWQEKSANVVWLAQHQEVQLGLSREVVKLQQNAVLKDSANASLRKDLNAVRDEKVALEEKLGKAQNEKDLANAEREEVSREKQRYADELLKLRGVITKQQAAVFVERENATRARNEKSEMENDLNATKQQLAAVSKDKRSIEEDLALQNRRVEALMKKGIPIIQLLGDDPSATQPYIADAQVLAVRPDVGLVMISAGSTQGVKPGFQFTVSRGDQYVGKVQVETVYPDMCSARILGDFKNKSGLDITVNDEARSR